jgi:hypothetical protein
MADLTVENSKVILLLGSPATGKTTALRNLPLERMAYINTDGKSILPFKGKKRIKRFIIPQDPLEVNLGVRALEEDPDIDYFVVDTLSFWLNALETEHIIFSEDSRGGWGKIYAAELQKLIHFATHVSKKHWIFISHTQESDKPVNFVTQTKCYGKGSVGKLGIEAGFSVVVYTHVYEKADKSVGYGLQVDKVPESIGLSVRAPMGMFDEPFMLDNDIRQVFKKIEEYENE